MTSTVGQLREELEQELLSILDYWKTYSMDEAHGGFVGQRDHNNKLVPNAAKGLILNTRILWSFAAAGNLLRDPELNFHARRAYDYLKRYFEDKEHQGVYWELDHLGKPVNRRKQIYGQAFAIYGLSEYYLLTKDNAARDWALFLFDLIEKHSRDRKEDGYLEAFQEDWTPIEDMRLSEKDINASKTMNTHLHVLEAYTSLYRISGDERVKEALNNLVRLFLEKFYNSATQHFHLFFDTHWNEMDRKVSYGHDIEAVWLLIEAAKAGKNEELLERAQRLAGPVADTFLAEAYIIGKGTINEKDLDTNEIDTDRHWWPQAEAMVGLEYTYKLTGQKEYREALLDIWEYVKKHIIDPEHGEWFFRVDSGNKPYEQEDKLGMWKCPYHNSRACMVLLEQLQNGKY